MWEFFHLSEVLIKLSTSLNFHLIAYGLISPRASSRQQYKCIRLCSVSKHHRSWTKPQGPLVSQLVNRSSGSILSHFLFDSIQKLLKVISVLGETFEGLYRSPHIFMKIQYMFKWLMNYWDTMQWSKRNNHI